MDLIGIDGIDSFFDPMLKGTRLDGRLCFYRESVIGLHPHVGEIPVDGSNDPLFWTVSTEIDAKIEHTVHVVRCKGISN